MPFVLSSYSPAPNSNPAISAMQYRLLTSGEIDAGNSSQQQPCHPGQGQVQVGPNQNPGPGQIMDFVHPHAHVHSHFHHHGGGGALVAMTNHGPIGSGIGGGSGSGHGHYANVNAQQSGALVPVSNQMFNGNNGHSHHPSHQKVHQLCHGHGHGHFAHFPSYVHQHQHHHHGHHGAAVIHHPSSMAVGGPVQQGQGQGLLPTGLIHQSRYFSGTGFHLAASRQNLQNQIQQQQLQQQQQQNYYASCFPPLMAPPAQQQQQDHQGQGQGSFPGESSSVALQQQQQQYQMSSSTSANSTASNGNSSSTHVKFANGTGKGNGTASGSGSNTGGGGGGRGGRSRSRSSRKEKNSKGNGVNQVKGHGGHDHKGKGQGPSHSSSGKIKAAKSATKVRDKAPRLVVSQKKKSVVNIGRTTGTGTAKKLKASMKVRGSISSHGTATSISGGDGGGCGGSTSPISASTVGAIPDNSAGDGHSLMGTIEGCLSSVSALTSVPFLHYPGQVQGQRESVTCCGGQCQAEGSVGLPSNFFEDFGAGDETVDFPTVAARVDADFASPPIMTLADICECGPATKIEYGLAPRMNPPQMRPIAPPGFESLIRPAFPIEYYDPSLLGNLVGNQLIRTGPLACFSSDEIEDVHELLDMISRSDEHAMERLWMSKDNSLVDEDEEISELSLSSDSDSDKENEDDQKKEENDGQSRGTPAKINVRVKVDPEYEIDQAEEDRKDWESLRKRFSRLLDEWTQELQYQRKMQQSLLEINMNCCLQGEGQGQGPSQTLHNSLDEASSNRPSPADSPDSIWSSSTWYGLGAGSSSDSSGRTSGCGTGSGTASGSASPDIGSEDYPIQYFFPCKLI